jgi:hypothetical protein
MWALYLTDIKQNLILSAVSIVPEIKYGEGQTSPLCVNFLQIATNKQTAYLALVYIFFTSDVLLVPFVFRGGT